MNSPKEIEKAIASLHGVNLAVYRCIEGLTLTHKDFTTRVKVIEAMKEACAAAIVDAALTELRQDLLVGDAGNGARFQTRRAAIGMPIKRRFRISARLVMVHTYEEWVDATDLGAALDVAKSKFVCEALETKDDVWQEAAAYSDEHKLMTKVLRGRRIRRR